MGGGVGKTLVKTLNTGMRVAPGEDFPIKEIPFLRRVFEEPSETSASGAYREAFDETICAV